MSATGSSLPVGFHASLGEIGSVTTAAASSAMCTSASTRRREYLASRCAYA